MSSSKEMVLVLCCLAYFTFALDMVNAEGNEGTFYHISDIHYDPYYGNGVYPSSSCRSPVNADEQTFGSYDCDSPWKLVFEALLSMSTGATGLTDFVVWTGDTPATLPQNVLNNQTLLDIFQNVSQRFKWSLPDIDVYPSIGNYDNYPINVTNPEPTKFRDSLADKWDAWLNDHPGATETFKLGGYYVATIPKATGSLWMIVLNTAMYDVKNAVAEGIEDPAGQFAWLENTLRYAEGNGTKVYISGHTPPGSLEREEKVTFRPSFNQRYLEIIREYHHLIKGQFFGHNQYDSFRIIYDDEGMPINAIYIQPALTPRRTPGPRNPSYRTVTYDRDTGDIIDIRQHYLDLANSGAGWRSEYVARKTYDVQNLSPQSLHDLVEEFKLENSTYFLPYYQFNNVKFPNTSECDEACKRGHICAITKLDIGDFEDCILGRNEDETTTGSSTVTPDDDDDNEDGTTSGSSTVTPDDDDDGASGDGHRARGSLISNVLLFLFGFLLIEMYQ